MAEVEVRIEGVKCARLSDSAKQDSEVTFDVNASLVERERNPGSLTLRFEISISTQPLVAQLSLAGSAVLVGQDEEIQNLITVTGQNSIPAVFMRIYQKVYATLYLLSGTIDIPYPAPGLLKTACLYSDKEIPRPLAPILA